MKSRYNKIVILLLICVLLAFAFFKFNIKADHEITAQNAKWWSIQGIDTVKYSRDIAREKAKDTSFDQTIDAQIKLIAQTGATHVSIGTPYDKEFVPFIERWVKSARKHNLNVWFRGNFSGWEKWFGYSSIDREEHKRLTKEFILSNGNLFEDGDISSACTECENGGPGDPRQNKDVAGHRQFLIDEYKITNVAFRNIDKNVRSNFFPMNGDVAKLIMDKDTTKALGGIVVIDHYVESSDQLMRDINSLSQASEGKIMLGEFGAPIPDIHGQMSQSDQAKWLKETFEKLIQSEDLIGANYWTHVGGSTQLWDSKLNARKAVEVLSGAYSPKTVNGIVLDELRRPISGATVATSERSRTTSTDGNFALPFNNSNTKVIVTAVGYAETSAEISAENTNLILTLKKDNPGFLFKLTSFYLKLVGKI